MTSVAPAIARKMRKSIQERGLRRRCNILGISNTRTNKAPTARWRSFLPKLSGCASTGVEVALIFDMSSSIFHNRSFNAVSWQQAADFAHACKGAPHVRNGDGAADDQRDVERIDHFLAFPAFLAAADQVIGDAVI